MGEPDLVANLANVCAALKEQFKWLWVGFYLVRMMNWFSGHSRGRLPVPGLVWAGEFAAPHGNRKKNFDRSECRGFSRSHRLQLRPPGLK